MFRLVVWGSPGIQARRFSRRGRIGPVETLRAGTEEEVRRPVVAADADGIVTVAWGDSVRAVSVIRVARFVR